MSAPGLSAMLWFRADPARDADVRQALVKVAEAVASQAPSRIGHRHDEDRAYRTWMIDVGPVAADRFDALLYRLHKAAATAGLPALAQDPPHLESFAWQDAARPPHEPTLTAPCA